MEEKIEIRAMIEISLMAALSAEAQKLKIGKGQMMREILRERYKPELEQAIQRRFASYGLGEPRSEAWSQYCQDHSLPYIELRFQKTWGQKQMAHMNIDLSRCSLTIGPHLSAIADAIAAEGSEDAMMRTSINQKELIIHNLNAKMAEAIAEKIAAVLFDALPS
jgi:hypothetical protein